MRHTIRTRDGGTVTLDKYARARAVKAFCTECMGWDEHPNTCTSLLCPLFPFRGRLMAAYREGEKDSEKAPCSAARIDERTPEAV